MKLNPIALLVIFCAFALGLVALRNQMSAHTAEAAAPASGAPIPAAGKPQPDVVAVGRTAYLRKEDNGHYWTNARVNGATIRMMVDSGATVVALTQRDAQRLHIDLTRLSFDKEVSTASGRVFAASISVDEIVIDRVKVANVPAVVIKDGLENSLLGMSFLGRLTSWQANARAMVIRQ